MRGAFRASRGFTLLEILIALVVLSMVGITAVKASGNAVNNILYLKQQTFGHWVAMNKAAEIELAPLGWEREAGSGTQVMVGAQWPWAVTIHETPDPDMMRVEVAVWAGGEEGEPVAVVTMYRSRR
jgi:general secretion pathway protein I